MAFDVAQTNTGMNNRLKLVKAGSLYGLTVDSADGRRVLERKVATLKNS